MRSFVTLLILSKYPANFPNTALWRRRKGRIAHGGRQSIVRFVITQQVIVVANLLGNMSEVGASRNRESYLRNTTLLFEISPARRYEVAARVALYSGFTLTDRPFPRFCLANFNRHCTAAKVHSFPHNGCIEILQFHEVLEKTGHTFTFSKYSRLRTFSLKKELTGQRLGDSSRRFHDK